MHPYRVERRSDGKIWIALEHAPQYAEVQEDTLRALDALSQTSTIDEAQRRLEKDLGEAIDINALAQGLLRTGFVASVDGVPAQIAPDLRRRDLLAKIPERCFIVLRSPPALAFFLLTWIVAAALYFGFPTSRPTGGDATVDLDAPLRSIVGFLALVLLAAYAHELGHYGVARSYGARATIRFTTRFYLVILQTDVTDASLLSRGKRLAIIVAGVSVNLLLWSAAYIAAVAGASQAIGMPSELISWLRMFAYANTIPIFFQIFIIARTDLYFALTVVLDEPNLMADSFAYLRWRVRRLWKAITRPETRKTCDSCGRRRVRGDPFCVHCGRSFKVRNPNRYPFSYAKRRVLEAAGVIMLASFYPSYAFIFNFFARFGTKYFEGAMVFYRIGVTHSLPNYLIAACIMMGYGVLQIGVAIWSMWRRMSTLVLGGWRMFARSRPPTVRREDERPTSLTSPQS